MNTSIPPPNDRRAVAYLRVSSARQRATGHSLDEDQPAVVARIEARYELQLVATFSDTYTGRTLDRPGLNALRAYLDTTGIRHVILAYSDRTSRARRRERHELADWLEDRGCILYTDDAPPMDLATPGGALMYDLTGAVSAHWMRLHVQRLCESRRNRSLAGLYTAPAPYGWRHVPRSVLASGEASEQVAAWFAAADALARRDVPGLYLPHPDRAPVVRELYERFAAGEGIAALVRWLNDSEVPTAYAADGRRHARVDPDRPALWRGTIVSLILANPIHIGVLRDHGRAGTVERPAANVLAGLDAEGLPLPLLPVALWQACQARREREGYRLPRDGRRGSGLAPRSRDSRAVLAGLVRCGACGSPCYAKRSQAGELPVYRCIAARTGACSEPGVGEAKLLAQIIPELQRHLTALAEAPPPEAVSGAAAHEAQRAALEGERRELLRLRLARQVGESDYAAEYARIEAELAALAPPPRSGRPPDRPTPDALDAALAEPAALRELLRDWIAGLTLADRQVVVTWR